MGIPIGTVAVNDQTGHRIVLTDKGWQELGSQQMPLPDADSKAMQALHEQVQEAQYLDQKGQQFVGGMDPQKQGQGSFATGPAYGAVGIPHVAENINPLATVVGAVDPRMGALESVTNQAWVHMRPQGSGAIRGYEATAFKDAFPNVTHWGPENQQIAGRLHQDSQIATQKLAFIDSYIRSGKGDYAAANAAWANGVGQAPITPDGRFMPPPVQGAPQQGGNPNIPAANSGPQVGQIEEGFQFMGGNAGDPRSWRPAPAAPLPAGAPASQGPPQ